MSADETPQPQFVCRDCAFYGDMFATPQPTSWACITCGHDGSAAYEIRDRDLFGDVA